MQINCCSTGISLLSIYLGLNEKYLTYLKSTTGDTIFIASLCTDYNDYAIFGL